MNENLVSIVIPAWNGTEHIRDCLRAVLAQNCKGKEIIVVDNNSQDGLCDIVEQEFPLVRLIKNERNLGFSGGCNVGIDAAGGDPIVLLNQDTVVDPNWLEHLISEFETDPAVGIAGSVCRYPDGRIQTSGGYIDERGSSYHMTDGSTSDQLRHTRNSFDDSGYVSGAALAISRKALTRVGKLDEGFHPAYYEDVDWCYRARRSGYRVVVAPNSHLIHKEESRLIDGRYHSTYHYHRNRLRFVFKHWSTNRIMGDFFLMEKVWLEDSQLGAEVLVAAVHRAYLHHILHVSEVTRERQRSKIHTTGDGDNIVRVLSALRSIFPIGPARLPIREEEHSNETIDQWRRVIHNEPECHEVDAI
ncbi:MAG: glycosyltransferase family 2 protein [Gammaproteobacteria bacterium]|nr:glycosyltransferase family 2 protein [Gammaproteobacteria bacterium]MDH3465443.1 glycosyltransferase family 2 protein [Gammaproteobacteria bacterium]